MTETITLSAPPQGRVPGVYGLTLTSQAGQRGVFQAVHEKAGWIGRIRVTETDYILTTKTGGRTHHADMAEVLEALREATRQTLGIRRTRR